MYNKQLIVPKNRPIIESGFVIDVIYIHMTDLASYPSSYQPINFASTATLSH